MIESAVQNNPEEIFEKRIGEYKVQKRPEALARYLQQALADSSAQCLPANLQAKLYNELGWALIQLERLGDARASYEHSMDVDPGNVTARYNLANLDMHTNDLARAIKRYDDLLTDVPDHGGALYNKAICHVLREEMDTALPCFEKMARVEPDYLGVQFWLGECHLRKGEFKDALPRFQKALALDGDLPEALRGAAICCFETGDYRQTIDLCDALLKKSGLELTALRLKGDACLALGDVESGVRCHLDMAFIEFDAREFLIHRAKRLAGENLEMAGEYCRRIIDHFPDFELALEPIFNQLADKAAYAEG